MTREAQDILDNMMDWYGDSAKEERAGISRGAMDRIISHLSEPDVIRDRGLSDQEIHNAIVAELENTESDKGD
jgi:hypothetical protein